MFADEKAREAFKRLSPAAATRMEGILAVRCYYNAPVMRPGVTGVHALDFDVLSRGFATRGFRDNPDAVLALPDLVDRMMTDGRLVVRPAKNGRDQELALVTAADPNAARGVNAAAYRRRLMERIAPDLDNGQKERLSDLFWRARTLEHCVDTRYGTLEIDGMGKNRFALGLPQIVAIGAEGAIVKSAMCVLLNARGNIKTFNVDANRMTVRFMDESWQVGMSLSGLKADKKQAVQRLLPRVEILVVQARHEVDWDGIEKWLCFAVPKRTRNSFVRALTMRRKNHMRLAGALLRRELDPVAISAMAKSGSEGLVETYNWFVGTGNAEILTRRRQAALAYPLLTPALVGESGLRKAVDAGSPLAPLLSAYTGMSPSVLRRVAKLHWQRTSAYASLVLSRRWSGPDIVSMLNACPVERLPFSRREWKSFLAFASHFTSVAEMFHKHPRQADGTFMRTSVANASRNWIVAGETCQGLYDMCQDIGLRLADAVSNQLRLADAVSNDPIVRHTYIDRWGIYRAVLISVVSGETLSLRSLSDRNVLWHARANDLRNGLASFVDPEGERIPPPISWPPLDDDFTSGDGGIRWLTNADELAAETKVLGHCVWSYSSNCLYQGSHIGSVTGSKGGRSTIEIKIIQQDGVLKPVVQQHQGIKNKPPGQDCNDVLAAFLKTRSDKVDCLTLQAALDERKANCPPDSSDDPKWLDDAFCDSIVELYRPFLCQEARELDRAGIAAATLACMPQ